MAIMGSMVSATTLGSGSLTGDAVRFTADTHLARGVVVVCGALCTVTALVCTGRYGLRVADRVYRDEPSVLANAPATAEQASPSAPG